MKRIILPVVFALSLVACDNDDDDAVAPDTIAPVVALDEPHDDERIQRGDEIHIEGTVVDDRGLSQMKIDIHYAGDGHGHGGKTSLEWEYEEILPISGTSFSFHEHVDIPTMADTGKHHLIIYAIDAAGNQGEFVEKDFYVTE